MVGDEVWNQQSKVRIVLGPLTLERYADFLPDGQSCEPLGSWVRFFSNDEWDFEVKLILEREQVPACTLGAEGVVWPAIGLGVVGEVGALRPGPGRYRAGAGNSGRGTVMNLKSLIGKLNDSTRGALEAAAGLCLARTHYDIEVEHYLTKLLDSTDNDVAAIFKHFEIDTSRLSGELARALDKLKTGNARTPALSPTLDEDVGRSLDHRLDRLRRRTGPHRLYHSCAGDE